MHADRDSSRTDAAPLELRLLGPFELIHGATGDPIPVSAPKVRALMAYLATTPRHTEGRRAIAGLLWPDKSETLARQSLRQLLSQFKLGADSRIRHLLKADDGAISLDASNLAIDRTALQEALLRSDIATLIRAADLYRGDFGIGAELDSPSFDEWVRTERLRCRDDAIRLVDRLVRALTEAGRDPDALAYANRLAAIDPMREETHRLVIATEAAVSGRASAMARYEQFRLLLREELGVRPEAATLNLLDRMREAPSAPEPIRPTALAVEATPATAAPVPRYRRRWRLGLAAGLATILLLGSGLGLTAARRAAPALPAASDNEPPVVVAVLVPHFDDSQAPPGLDAYQAAARRVLTQSPHVTVRLTAADDAEPSASYLIRTEMQRRDGRWIALATLYDRRSGGRIYTASAAASGDPGKLGQAVFPSIYQAIVLHHARELTDTAPEAPSTLLWQVMVERNWNGSRAPDPPQFVQLEAVLARDPNNVEALIGQADVLIERVARDMSRGLNRIDDLYRADRDLSRARRVVAPDAPRTVLARIPYLQGLLDKVEGRLPEARARFLDAAGYLQSGASARAQAAHITLLMGHIEDAFAEMEAIPNFDYRETAFIAAETALIAGHADRALYYFDRAVSMTPDIPRNYAWRAIALWRLHRPEEAHQDALKSQQMTPAYRPYFMKGRADIADGRYREARDRCVEDFDAALAYQPPA